MDPPVTGELRVERGGQDPPLANHDGMFADLGKDFHFRTDFLDPGSPDEDGMEWLAQASDFEISLERLVLPAEGIALDHDVERPHQRLVTLGHCSGEEDHPGTSPVDGQAFVDGHSERLQQPETGGHLPDSGRLPSWDDESVDVGELIGRLDRDGDHIQRVTDYALLLVEELDGMVEAGVLSRERRDGAAGWTRHRAPLGGSFAGGARAVQYFLECERPVDFSGVRIVDG